MGSACFDIMRHFGHDLRSFLFFSGCGSTRLYTWYSLVYNLFLIPAFQNNGNSEWLRKNSKAMAVACGIGYGILVQKFFRPQYSSEEQAMSEMPLPIQLGCILGLYIFNYYRKRQQKKLNSLVFVCVVGSKSLFHSIKIANDEPCEEDCNSRYRSKRFHLYQRCCLIN